MSTEEAPIADEKPKLDLVALRDELGKFCAVVGSVIDKAASSLKSHALEPNKLVRLSTDMIVHLKELMIVIAAIPGITAEGVLNRFIKEAELQIANILKAISALLDDPRDRAEIEGAFAGFLKGLAEKYALSADLAASLENGFVVVNPAGGSYGRNLPGSAPTLALDATPLEGAAGPGIIAETVARAARDVAAGRSSGIVKIGTDAARETKIGGTSPFAQAVMNGLQQAANRTVMIGQGQLQEALASSSPPDADSSSKAAPASPVPASGGIRDWPKKRP